jgi:hypothetical protein
MPPINVMGIKTEDRIKGDAYNRFGHFLHCLDRRFSGRLSVLDVQFDGVIDDQARS